MMNKWSKRFIGIGILCLLAAFCLTAYNIWSDAQAGETADSALQQMKQLQDNTVQDTVNPSEEEIPDYILNPEMDMPTQNIDGQDMNVQRFAPQRHYIDLPSPCFARKQELAR